ncbi:MAG: ATP-dependent helicase HrpB [Planctomycetaceae bacterium]
MPSPATPLPADLPVAAVLDRVVTAARGGSVVVTAPPGSGKTMLVPAALLDDLPPTGGVVLLQPRRLAARAVAGRIAALRGSPLGGEVGYRVRFDTKAGPGTRLAVETTGIMLRRLLDDPGLGGIDTVVLDEFHERSLEMDIVLGLLVRVREALRPDLRIAVMSATLDAAPVAALLGGGPSGPGCPVIAASGRVFPVETRYLRHGDRRDLVDLVGGAVQEALRSTDGHVLVFLPGRGEIGRCQAMLATALERQDVDCMPLHGELPPADQDRVLDETGRRKVILATNVAETSLTIPGVTGVVDSGLARQARTCPGTGLPRLELVPISRASAEQRAGRAGRTAPGVCLRLWDEAAHHQRPAAETPEALRGDLAGPLLHLLALGEARGFPWLDPPPEQAIAAAWRLLANLGAVDPAADNAGRITPLGVELSRLPAHPRLARLLLAGTRHGVLAEAAVAAALLSDRDPFRTPRPGTGPRDRHRVRSRSDIVDRVAALRAFAAGRPGPAGADPDLEPHDGAARAVLRVAGQLERLVETPPGPRAADPATALMRSLLEAFPDRLARLRPGAQDRATLVGGRGVRLTSSRLRGEPFFLAIDVDDAGGEAAVRQASAVERAWLDEEPSRHHMRTTDELLFHPSRRQVEARTRTAWMDLVLDEAPMAIRDHEAAAALLAGEAARYLERVVPDADSAAGSFLARARWLAGAVPDVGLPPLDDAALTALLPALCRGRRSLDELPAADWLDHLRGLVGHDRARDIERLAPPHVELSSGRRLKLTYAADGPPVLAARIQDLYGVAETPRIAAGRVPVLLHLLGPNHRPQQVTGDLAGFWKTTYPKLRQELRRRYPKHAWPDDPLARS